MDRLKFIHAADLHLGTPLESSYDLPPEINKTVKDATYFALERICDLAISHKVDFIILSGDVFDQQARSIKAEDFLKKQINRLQDENIFIFTIAGNHDPINERSISYFQEHENAHLFSSEEPEEKEITSGDNSTVRIIGQSYRSRADSRKMINYFTPTREEHFNVGILHTQLDPANKSYVPCSEEDLKNKKGIDYWALGHIHKGEILAKKDPTIVYPGTPQGRHVGEKGLKGCFMVTVENHKLKSINFFVTSPVIWLEKEVSINDSNEGAPENITELEEFLINEGEKLINGDICYDLMENDNLLTTTANVNTYHDNRDNNDNNDYNDINDNDIDDIIKGYMVRWVITGKSSLHQELEEQQQEAMETILSSLRRRFSYYDPFLWSDSIIFRTTRPLPPIEELKKQSDVFYYIDILAEKCLNDPEIKKQILEEFGEGWEYQEDHENYNEKKLQLNDESMAVLIEKAKELAVEKLLDRRDE